MEKVRTALIGCGKVGRTHAQALSALPESEFVAVCDNNPERAKAFAAEFGTRAFGDVQEMVEQAGVQAVTICTPHPLHVSPAIQAAQAGAHVIIEKPLAPSLKDCDAIISAADSAGVQLGVISQRRLYEPVQRVKAAIEAGKIGRPILGLAYLFCWRDQAYFASDPWRGKWSAEGGGVLVNQAPHQLDILQWFMGPVEEVFGYWDNLNHPYIEVEDTAVAVLRFRNGALGNLVLSNSQRPGLYGKVHVHGENGASVGVQTDGGSMFIAGMAPVLEPPLNDLWTVPGEEHLLEEWKAEDTARFQEIDPAMYYHQLQIQDFLQAVRDGREPLVTGREGRKLVEIFTAIYRSQRDRKPVRFPLDAKEGSEDYDGRLAPRP